MARQVAHASSMDASAVVRCLHRLVIYGPRDPDIAVAMSPYGYDAVKWAEGQGVLAELVSSERAAGTILTTATAWYEEAAGTARHALAAQPQLLEKLGMA